ncbi:MAG: glycosyltransferase family 1 protein [Chloroflexaceae bacterium]|nr:glycosyltransferase family 1 protein [Chloroflexaceae bacterium]
MLAIHSSPLAQIGGKEAGGMNVYVRELATQLGARGQSVDIFTRYQDSTLPPSLPLGPNVRLIHLTAGAVGPYDKNRILDHLPALLTQLNATQAANPAPYRLIHSHYWVSGAVALALREQWRVPVVQMFHTLGALKNRVARSPAETETLRRIEIEQMLMQHADVIVAATALDAEQMHSHYHPSAPIQIIPPGVNLAHFTPMPQAAARQQLGLPLDQRILVCVGRMEPLKGMDNLIRALALLHTQHPAWRESLRVILIGGDNEHQSAGWNPEQHRLHALRHSIGAADAVLFAGAQPHPALPAWYAAADALVVPSHYESFGMVVLEGMACGVPVIASNVGGMRFSIEPEQSGILVPPDDSPALAQALHRLLTTPALQARLRQGGIARAAQYSWSRITDQIEQLYRQVLLTPNT